MLGLRKRRPEETHLEECIEKGAYGARIEYFPSRVEIEHGRLVTLGSEGVVYATRTGALLGVSTVAEVPKEFTTWWTKTFGPLAPGMMFVPVVTGGQAFLWCRRSLRPGSWIRPAKRSEVSVPGVGDSLPNEAVDQRCQYLREVGVSSHLGLALVRVT